MRIIKVTKKDHKVTHTEVTDEVSPGGSFDEFSAAKHTTASITSLQ